MSKLDPSDRHGRSDMTTCPNAMSASGVPPVLPPLPSRKRKLTPLAIAAICVAGLATFLAVGTLAVGMFVRARAADARELKSERAGAFDAREVKSEPGLTYTNVTVASVPWSISVLKIDRSRKDLTFFAAHAKDKVLGVSMLADQARAVPREVGRALAGVNGDFYVRDRPPYSGDPRGLQILNGDLISAPDTVCVWFDANGNPHLDEVKGSFQITWPDGRKTPFGLNEQRRSNMAVLYTPSYGASTLANGGREVVLEKDGDGLWLPLQASENYRARVREVRTNGNTRLVPDVMVL